MSGIIDRRRYAGIRRVELDRSSFTWGSGNVERNGSISAYPNVVSEPVHAEGFRWFRFRGDGRYWAMIVCYDSRGKIILRDDGNKSTESRGPGYGLGPRREMPEGTSTIRVMLWDKPSKDYVRNESTVKVILIR